MNGPSGVRDVCDATFSAIVVETGTSALVEFWDPEWGPCQLMEPVIATLAASRCCAIDHLRLDIAENPVTVARHMVGDAPGLHLFAGGRLVAFIDGTSPLEHVEARLDRLAGPSVLDGSACRIAVRPG